MGVWEYAHTENFEIEKSSNAIAGILWTKIEYNIIEHIQENVFWFISRSINDILFVYNVIKSSCFFFRELKISWLLWVK